MHSPVIVTNMLRKFWVKSYLGYVTFDTNFLINYSETILTFVTFKSNINVKSNNY